jgi:addiction module HigA family antidote
MSTRPRKPPPIHPGEILLEKFIKPLNLTMNRLADRLHIAPNRITQIVKGQRSVTGETAPRLARYFGTSPEFWLGLQKDYDLAIARDEFEAQVKRHVQPGKIAVA